MYIKKLEDLRLQHNLTKREVAKKFNVAESTYGKWELGQRKPDLDTITAIADFYHVSTDYLIGNTDDPTPPNEKKDPLEGLKFALWGDDDISDEALEDVRRFAQFIAEKEKEKKDGGTK